MKGRAIPCEAAFPFTLHPLPFTTVPIIDLITPWAAAARSGDQDELAALFRRNAEALEPIRRQRAPTESALPAPAAWDTLAEQAADDTFQQRLREARDRLSDRGLVAPQRIVLLASAAPGGPFEVIPGPGATTIALFIDRAPGVTPAQVALAAGMAALTRWTTPGNPIATIAARGHWDRWAAAREVSLAEWVYAAGLGVHAAGWVAERRADALGLADGDLARLRQAERALQIRLDGDLDHAGVGLVLRWLEDDAPVAMRRATDGSVIPRGAGRYLGWRMLAERVERVGIAEAAGMAA